MLYENIQIIDGKKTIGEIDFIIEELKTKALIHMELAYKFYLFDPSISSEPINNWIGPNRNDSLREKLDKLKQKQLPLLYQNCAKAKFNNIEIGKIGDRHSYIRGYDLPNNSFLPFVVAPLNDKVVALNYNKSEKEYHLPPKKEWGMNPSENENWTDFAGVENFINTSMKEKQASLCWQK